MGFKEVRARVIEALRSRHYQHEGRADKDEKNLLDAEKVTNDFIVLLLLRCTGEQYGFSRHHLYPDLVCHIFTPERWGEQWYIKVYFRANVAVFISVHPS